MGDNLQQMQAGRETEARHDEALQLVGGGAGAMVVFHSSPSLWAEFPPAGMRSPGQLALNRAPGSAQHLLGLRSPPAPWCGCKNTFLRYFLLR